MLHQEIFVDGSSMSLSCFYDEIQYCSSILPFDVASDGDLCGEQLLPNAPRRRRQQSAVIVDEQWEDAVLGPVLRMDCNLHQSPCAPNICRQGAKPDNGNGLSWDEAWQP